MTTRKPIQFLFALAAALLLALPVTALAEEGQYFPVFSYRTGPYAPNGVPLANGFKDYYEMINARDGGINGVKAIHEECETQYDTKLSIECYEKMKNRHSAGASYFNPFSTGVTYALIPKASVDKVPILSMGYGRTAAADGRVFPWVFNFPTTYWSQASALIRYIGAQEGDLAKLKGKKIVLVYHNSAYGKEPISTLEVLSRKYGFDLRLLAVDHPGQEQKATWLQIRRYKPDWILMWGWGVMNQVAIKEAAGINYPMDHFIGVWWSGTETDTVPAGDGAKGYKAATFHPPGPDAEFHKDILKYVYKGDLAAAKRNNFGQVLYNRGIVNAIFGVEAVMVAQAKYGNKAMNGEQVRWGMENIDMTPARIAAHHATGFIQPIKISCADHEVGNPILIQQWDGEQWKIVSEWIPAMRDIVRPLIEEAAAAYAKENNITPRDC